MAKEKWYITTGRESDEVKRKATKIMFGVTGSIQPNRSWRYWSSEPFRTAHRMLSREDNAGVIVAYTLGEMI